MRFSARLEALNSVEFLHVHKDPIKFMVVLIKLDDKEAKISSYHQDACGQGTWNGSFVILFLISGWISAFFHFSSSMVSKLQLL